jgi:hypothetical protein
MAETKDEARAREASTVDVNEEQVGRTRGSWANDEPHPNPHIAGQTPGG